MPNLSYKFACVYDMLIFCIPSRTHLLCIIIRLSLLYSLPYKLRRVAFVFLFYVLFLLVIFNFS
jgi:hypothetical protein